jgi:hypothetical protein
MAIATDRVDPELVYLTFAALLFLLRANVDHFRTGWFVESVVSASLIVLIIRTRQPYFKSKPGAPLWIATLLVIVATVVLPLYTELRFGGNSRSLHYRGRDGEEAFYRKQKL